MSIIPKISIGVSNRKYRHNKSFDSQSTCNFGEIYPSMSREVIPNESNNIKLKSLVRLASMPRPTFGRMSLRNYLTFVKYSDLWKPFDNFIAQKGFTDSTGVSTIFSECPSFKYSDFQQLVLNYSIISITQNGGDPFTIDTTSASTFSSSRGNIAAAISKILTFSPAATGLSFVRGSSNKVYADTDFLTGSNKLSDNAYNPYEDFSFGGLYTGNNRILPFGHFYGIDSGNYFVLPNDLSSYLTWKQPANGDSCIIPSRENADLILDGADIGLSNYTIYFKFKPILKHLRKIFIGLGYQFNVLNQSQWHNFFKLGAFYKSWFELFRPQRLLQYTDTSCYKMFKEFESDISPSNNTWYKSFIVDLMKDTYYYFPSDYFSMSQDYLGDSTDESNSLTFPISGSLSNNYTTGNVSSNNTAVFPGAAGQYPLVQKIAQRLLQYTNKNNIIGRNIRDYLRIHYGISDENLDVNGVYKVGNNRVNIDTYDVISQSETTEAFLGEYAGRGIGSGSSDSFNFKADNFGCITCLTCIVPESGYYQGTLRENNHIGRLDFFNESFDAMGYQILTRSELKDDFDVSAPTTQIGNVLSTGSGGFGFVPRYSEYKVGRNIVNGDLSLPSMINSMSPYYLDKRYGSRYWVDNYTSPNFKAFFYTEYPEIVSDTLRKFDGTDTLGNFNRIFNYTANDIDHFIVQQVFDVNTYNNAKSLANSFDTFEDDKDTSTIDMIHQ